MNIRLSPQPQATTKSVGEIAQEFADLERTISYLSEELEALESALTPVLRSSGALEESALAREAPCTLLASSLRATTIALQGSLVRVRSLHQRLEL